MSAGGFNVAELLKQLGLKSLRDLPLVEAIQPTLPVGDASGLSSPLLAPTCWAGGPVAAVVGRLSGFQIQSLGAGGCWVRELRAGTTGANGYWRMILSATEPAGGNYGATALTNHDMAPTPVLSRCSSGDSNVNLGADCPTWPQSNFTTVPFVDGIYLPHGFFCAIEFANINMNCYFAALVQDVPAAPLSPTG